MVFANKVDLNTEYLKISPHDNTRIEHFYADKVHDNTLFEVGNEICNVTTLTGHH